MTEFYLLFDGLQNIFFLRISDILEKSWKRRRWRKPTNTKRFAFETNAIKRPTEKLF